MIEPEHVVEYRFNVRLAVDRDGSYLVLFRYTWDGYGRGPNSLVKAEVLTNDGFVDCDQGMTFDPMNVPFLDGRSRMWQDKLQATLDAFERRVQGVIKDSPPTAHFCVYKRALVELAGLVSEGDASAVEQCLVGLSHRNMLDNPVNYAKVE